MLGAELLKKEDWPRANYVITRGKSYREVTVPLFQQTAASSILRNLVRVGCPLAGRRRSIFLESIDLCNPAGSTRQWFPTPYDRKQTAQPNSLQASQPA